jgi:hypothetical protein
MHQHWQSGAALAILAATLLALKADESRLAGKVVGIRPEEYDGPVRT